jgi:hypothetical protein
MNKYEIDPNKKTIRILEPVKYADFIFDMENISSVYTYTILPSDKSVINDRFTFSNSTIGTSFDEKG